MSTGNAGNILLETGTNELEVLEFTIAGNSFGINVAKITELMQAQEIQMMPNAHPCIEGIINPRGTVFTVVDLAKYLGLPESTEPEKDIYIITGFNKMNVAFHVHGVMGINRISWQAIDKPDALIFGGEEGVVTGIAKVGERIISILDFEKITFDINADTGIKLEDVEGMKGIGNADRPILVAEDSALLRRMILEALRTSGYTNITMTMNGQEAWDYLQSHKADMHPSTPWMDLSCIITDIEMPKMDGHRLTKLIKGDAVLSKIPVVIFSSLIDDTMRLKGLQVGADAQLSKPEIAELVGTVTELINKYRKGQ